MKITKNRLRQIILEEVKRFVNETVPSRSELELAKGQRMRPTGAPDIMAKAKADPSYAVHFARPWINSGAVDLEPNEQRVVLDQVMGFFKGGGAIQDEKAMQIAKYARNKIRNPEDVIPALQAFGKIVGDLQTSQ